MATTKQPYAYTNGHHSDQISIPLSKKKKTKIETRRSSCVNARGIPPAAYQVFTLLLSLPMEGGGYPHPVLNGGTPMGGPSSSPDGGYPGVPPLSARLFPMSARWVYLPPPHRSDVGTSLQSARWGYPPLRARCEQTENITFRHPSDTDGNSKSVLLHERKRHTTHASQHLSPVLVRGDGREDSPILASGRGREGRYPCPGQWEGREEREGIPVMGMQSGRGGTPDQDRGTTPPLPCGQTNKLKI